MSQVVTDMIFYYQYLYLVNNEPDKQVRIEKLVNEAEASAAPQK